MKKNAGKKDLEKKARSEEKRKRGVGSVGGERSKEIRGNDFNKFRGGGRGRERIAGHLTEERAVNFPGSGRNGPDIAFNSGPFTVEMRSGNHIDLFGNGEEAVFIRNSERDRKESVIEAFVASGDTEQTKRILNIHKKILPNKYLRR